MKFDAMNDGLDVGKMQKNYI